MGFFRALGLAILIALVVAAVVAVGIGAMKLKGAP